MESHGTSDSDGGNTRTGIIAGSVVGGVVLLAAIGLIGFIVAHKRSSRHNNAAAREESSSALGYNTGRQKEPVLAEHSPYGYVSTPTFDTRHNSGTQRASELPEFRH